MEESQMIEVTKPMKLVLATYFGKCVHCKSEFKATSSDLRFDSWGAIQGTTCGECSVGHVKWKEVLPVRYEEIKPKRPPSTEYVRKRGYGATCV